MKNQLDEFIPDFGPSSLKLSDNGNLAHELYGLFTFTESDIPNWLFMYFQGTRVYLKYDATTNRLIVSNDNYLNQLYYFRLIPFGAMKGIFGIEAKAGTDCTFYCGNKYLRSFAGSFPLGAKGVIDGTTDASEMLLFRII